MAGPLGSIPPAGDFGFTGAPAQDTFKEMNQDAVQVRRSKHGERAVKTKDFKVGNAASAKPMQQPPSMSNLRTKSDFKRKRYRK